MTLIDPATGEGWDQHVYWDNETEMNWEHIPAAVRKLVGARARLQRMIDLGAPKVLIEGQQWCVHQAIDQMEMWADWLREQTPAGKRIMDDD